MEVQPGTGPNSLPEIAAFYRTQLLDDCTPFWLEASRSGVEFLGKYALDGSGRAYYKVTREGVPVYSRPWQIFAESFVVLAYAEYSKASGTDEYLKKGEEAVLEHPRQTRIGGLAQVREPSFAPVSRACSRDDSHQHDPGIAGHSG